MGKATPQMLVLVVLCCVGCVAGVGCAGGVAGVVLCCAGAGGVLYCVVLCCLVLCCIIFCSAVLALCCSGVGGAVLMCWCCLVLCCYWCWRCCLVGVVLRCAATGGVGVEKVSENNQRNTASQTTGYRREVKYKQYDKK